MTSIAVLPLRRNVQTLVKKFSGVWFTLTPSPVPAQKWWGRGVMTGFNPNHRYDERMVLNAHAAIKRLSKRTVIVSIVVRGPLPTMWFFGPVNY